MDSKTGNKRPLISPGLSMTPIPIGAKISANEQEK
jgi:hypothetical protein